MKQSLHIVHLYPKEMNIYGDTGNRIILEKRLEKRGIETTISLVGLGDDIPADADIIIGGGGQDAGQGEVQDDLLTKADDLKKAADSGVVMLMVCGLYQLFGRKFITHQKREIKGIGILPLETYAEPIRLIGNTVIDTPWGEVIAYENHSGQTFLDDPNTALGTVVKGAGNNGKDKTEGCLVLNVFGTYSHGPVLSKNPELADELISRALKRKYGQDVKLPELDDSLELRAQELARKRPR